MTKEKNKTYCDLTTFFFFFVRFGKMKSSASMINTNENRQTEFYRGFSFFLFLSMFGFCTFLFSKIKIQRREKKSERKSDLSVDLIYKLIKDKRQKTNEKETN